MTTPLTEQAKRLASWLRAIAATPGDAPYFSNGMFRQDCFNAAECAERLAAIAVPASPVQPLDELVAMRQRFIEFWSEGHPCAANELEDQLDDLLAAFNSCKALWLTIDSLQHTRDAWKRLAQERAASPVQPEPEPDDEVKLAGVRWLLEERWITYDDLLRVKEALERGEV